MLKTRAIAIVTFSLLGTGALMSAQSAHANNARTVSPVPAADPVKAFANMVSRLDQLVNKDKKRLFAIEHELSKMTKGVEMAGYRVVAARERYDERKAKLDPSAPSKADTMKLNHDHFLLKKDAIKLGKLLATIGKHRAEMAAMVSPLKSLSDDVAIEADRFDPDKPNVKRAYKLVADAEWALAKIEELNQMSQADLVEPISEQLSKTAVGMKTGGAARIAEPAEFTPAKVAGQTLQSSSATGQYTPIGQLKRGDQQCAVQCMIDDPAGVSGKPTDVQMHCTAGANSAGLIVLSRWNAGNPTFPQYSGVHHMGCE